MNEDDNFMNYAKNKKRWKKTYIHRNIEIDFAIGHRVYYINSEYESLSKVDFWASVYFDVQLVIIFEISP